MAVDQELEALHGERVADEHQHFLVRASYLEIYNEEIRDLLYNVVSIIFVENVIPQRKFGTVTCT